MRPNNGRLREVGLSMPRRNDAREPNASQDWGNKAYDA